MDRHSGIDSPSSHSAAFSWLTSLFSVTEDNQYVLAFPACQPDIKLMQYSLQWATSSSLPPSSTAAHPRCSTSGMCVFLLGRRALSSAAYPGLSASQAKEADASPLTDVDYLLVVAGNSDEENPYRKGSALQVRSCSLTLFRCSPTKTKDN